MRSLCQSFKFFFETEIIPNLNIQSCDVSWDKPFIVEACIRIACQQDNLVILEKLLQYDPNLAVIDDNQASLLMYARSVDAVKLIMNKARETNCLKSLLLIKIQNRFTVFDVFFSRKRFELIEELMQCNDFYNYIDVNALLTALRAHYFKSLDNHQLIDKLCIQLRDVKNNRRKLSRVFNEKKDQMDFFTAANWLDMPAINSFGPKSSRNSAIQHAIIQLFSLLSTPTACIKYFQLINWELMRYHQKKYGVAFPKLDDNNRAFQTIDGLDYPIPTLDYIGIKKNSALQECLVAILNARGLANKGYKWIGFIPNDSADDMMRQGDFVVECRFGSGLFHTKTAHMLQFVILIYAIESGHIQLDYFEGNDIKHISVVDILDTLVTEKIQKAHGFVTLWSLVLDSRKEICGFTDPFRLGSLLMSYGKQWQITALSDALVDTFCKGFLRLLSAVNATNPSLQLTPVSFVQTLDDLELEKFGVFDLFQYSVQREGARTNKPRFFKSLEPNERHAIVEKNYEGLPSFQPLHLIPFAINRLSQARLILYQSLWLDSSCFDEQDWVHYIHYVLLEASSGNSSLLSMVQMGLMEKQYKPPADSPLFAALKTLFNEKNQLGLTALQTGITLKNKEIICYLLAFGVDYINPFKASNEYKALLSDRERAALLALLSQGTETAMLPIILEQPRNKPLKMHEFGLKNRSGQHAWCNNTRLPIEMVGYGLKPLSGYQHLFWSHHTPSRVNPLTVEEPSSQSKGGLRQSC